MIGQTDPYPDADASQRSPDLEQTRVHSPIPAPLPEVGGREGLDPVRYGDWEKNGRCVDF